MTSANVSCLESEIAEWRQGHSLPYRLRDLSMEFSQRALAILFPHFRSLVTEAPTVKEEMQLLCVVAREAMTPLLDPLSRSCEEPEQTLLERLKEIRSLLLEDAQAMYANDPAAESVDEVILAYPGFMAIALHRIAHVLYQCDVPVFPRLIGEYAHQVTSIDIHPGAQIGREFSIDHGTGVVIGETTQIGSGVRLYQGVTLGALSVRKDLADTKRHPTLEDRVIVYAGATILGGKTVVGHDSVIGGNVWVTRSVPAQSVVTFDAQTRSREEFDLEYII